MLFRGTSLHENLATSYVMIDALVADLCEGGFSGFVEIVLRQADALIFISGGEVVGALERPTTSADAPWKATSVARLAEAGRGERGRVSVATLPAAAAPALAARLLARPLYTGLTTEFADLEKMAGKLGREGDRRWFIELRKANGDPVLLAIRQETCLLLFEEGEALRADEGPLDPDANATLAELLAECRRAPGRFDVLFTPAEEALFIEDEPEPEPIPEPLEAELAAEASAASTMLLTMPPAVESADFEEVKQLMADIIRRIEETVRNVEGRDLFPLHLRAGQLRVADQYPFLDPFAAEFEYLSGEIVFAGRAGVTQFVDGLAEALRSAVATVSQTSSHGERLRGRIIEELRRLLERRREEFARFNIDLAIERIVE